MLSSTVGGQIRTALAEYSGVDRTHPLDAFACGAGTAAAAETGTTPVVRSGDLAIAGLASGTNPMTVAAGDIGGRKATIRTLITGKTGTLVDEDVLSTASVRQSAGMRLSSNGAWSSAIVAFRRAS
jgi:hypothetical protein